MAKTILLADDSMTIQKVVELTFMAQDYRVVAVSDGNAALGRLADLEPDLVIADVHMPGPDGYEVCREVKKRTPGLPVLLLVGTFEQFDESQARECGAEAHLKKPFDSQELLSHVETLLSAAEATLSAAETTLSAAETTLSAAEANQPAQEESAPFVSGFPTAPSIQELVDSNAPGFSSEEAYVPDPPAPTEVEPSFAAPPAFEPAAPLPTQPTPVPNDFDRSLLESSTNIPLATEVVEEAALGAAGSNPADTESIQVADLGYAPKVEEEVVAEVAVEQEPPVVASAPPLEIESTRPMAALPQGIAEHSDSSGASDEAAEPAQGSPDSGERSLGQQGGLGQLSDSDVDRIARRVAELIGDAVVRDVAWDVLPDLAEVVVRERIRELESQVESV